jgi:hypothetical protein
LAQRSCSFEAAPVGGFLMPHHSDMLYLIDGHIRGVEASIHWATEGSKNWHHAFNFPSWGIATAYYDLASGHLGKGISIHAFLDLPIDKQRRYYLMMGLGGGYISEPFDPETNFQNGAIGSHLNASLALTAFRKWTLGQKLNLRAGIGIRHFSNGAMKVPNSGINLAVATLALRYNAAPASLPERQPVNVPDKSWRLWTGLSGGLKEVLPIGGQRYTVFNLFANAVRPINAKSSFGFEAGVNFNNSLSPRAAELGRAPAKRENWRSFAAAQYLFHFGNLALRLQAGCYILPTFEEDGLVFFRYHLVYSVERFQAFTGLKSHFAKADNIEIGLAYRLL